MEKDSKKNYVQDSTEQQQKHFRYKLNCDQLLFTTVKINQANPVDRKFLPKPGTTDLKKIKTNYSQ